MSRESLTFIKAAVLMSALLCPCLSAATDPNAPKPEEKWRFNARIDAIWAQNAIWGPGSRTRGLATMQNTTLFEQDWGSRFSTFNGSGITVNKNYPITDGGAVSANLRFGGAWNGDANHSGGIEGLIYLRDGDPTVARVFGEELPFGNFKTEDGKLIPATSSIQLGKAWYRAKETWGDAELNFGQLDSSNWMGMARKDSNYMRLSSLLFRSAISTTTFLGKDDRKFRDTRSPLFGFTAIGNYRPEHGSGLHFDLIAAHQNPTPISNISRAAQGGRLSSQLGPVNLGASYFHQEGKRLPEIESERQDLWAVDFSANAGKGALYGAVAHSDYQRNVKQNGNAIVLGYRIPWGKDGFWSLQIQSVDASYDLMGSHKAEHYPSNFVGAVLSSRSPIQHGIRTSGNLYLLSEKSAFDSRSGIVWGDSFFPNLPGSEHGSIAVGRLAVESAPSDSGSWIAYFERAQFEKQASAGNSIDKSISNLNALCVRKICNGVNLSFGARYVWATGHWQQAQFDHGQLMPEIGLEWKNSAGSRVWLHYNRYDFWDHNSASAGRNNWKANQLALDIQYRF